MRSTIFLREPPSLREMRAGDLFVPHDASLQECVCARLAGDEGTTDVEVFNDDEIVVIACRAHKGEPGYHPPGYTKTISMDIWVTPVDLIERPSFRERMPLDEIPAVAPERAEPATRPAPVSPALFEIQIRSTAPAG